MLSKLKQTRLERGYSIQEVSDRLNIRRQYLVDIEEGNFHALPGKVYVNGYLKIYSKFLGIESTLSCNSDCDNSLEGDGVQRENGDMSFFKRDIRYQKYFVIISIISLIIIFFSYNIIKSADYSGVGIFREVLNKKLLGDLYAGDASNAGDYSTGIDTEADYSLDDILSVGDLYIDQDISAEDDMVMQDIKEQNVEDRTQESTQGAIQEGIKDQ